MNRQIGATFIVAGTTIGAGMLAMPLTAAPLGFLGSIFALFLLWGLMYTSALMMVKCSLKTSPGQSIAWIAGDIFGAPYKHLLTGILILFLNALLAAYMEGGSSLLAIQLPHVSQDFLRIGFLAVFGLPLVLGTHWLDRKNRILFMGMMIIFAIMVWLLIPNVSLSHLDIKPAQTFSTWSLVLPVFFTSFGFHASIPSLIHYCGNDESKLKSIMLWGSLLPCVIYFLWLLVTEGVLPLSGPQSFSSLPNEDVGIFMAFLGGITKSPMIALLSSLFAFLAIATSFLGVGMGLFDLILERLPLPRLIVAVLTFSPAYFIGALFPEGFIEILKYAAIFLSILAVITPALILLKLKEGSPLLSFGMLIFGLIIIVLGV
ncbi:Tyrosine-specific transport protein [Candidatus Bealeia paramacronuclearis]|uniref:Tyrosine-specific transport protein n=1 Tax=Candidatus Bealeia paramacronuclearis TaxID=1921001 RepID=A0ABZ2C893_9PROT|nr:Tyrosine-specific transport protein [Candidatus Bealeia paramacronuclearis]